MDYSKNCTEITGHLCRKNRIELLFLTLYQNKQMRSIKCKKKRGKLRKVLEENMGEFPK